MSAVRDFSLQLIRKSSTYFSFLFFCSYSFFTRIASRPTPARSLAITSNIPFDPPYRIPMVRRLSKLEGFWQPSKIAPPRLETVRCVRKPGYMLARPRRSLISSRIRSLALRFTFYFSLFHTLFLPDLPVSEFSRPVHSFGPLCLERLSFAPVFRSLT